jgi:hypothetical protein
MLSSQPFEVYLLPLLASLNSARLEFDRSIAMWDAGRIDLAEVAHAAMGVYNAESKMPWIGKKRATTNYVSTLRTIVSRQEERLKFSLEYSNDALREIDDIKAELTRLDSAHQF